MHEYEFFQGSGSNVQRGVACFENRVGINKTRSMLKECLNGIRFITRDFVPFELFCTCMGTQIHNEIANILFYSTISTPDSERIVRNFESYFLILPPLSLFIERKLKSSFRKIVRLFIVVYRKFYPMLFFQRLLPVKNSFLLKKERIVYYKKGSCFLIRDRGYFIFQFSNQPKTLNPPSTFSFTFWSFLYRNPLFPLD